MGATTMNRRLTTCRSDSSTTVRDEVTGMEAHIFEVYKRSYKLDY